MGTRLYITADNATLEMICAAPEGAWAKMEAICEAHKGHSDAEYDRREAEFDKHEGTGRCHDFDLFGFGKLNSEQWALVRSITSDEDDMYCGCSTDPAVISKMLTLCDGHGAGNAWFLRHKITKVSWS
jgi:hypothetical protein